METRLGWVKTRRDEVKSGPRERRGGKLVPNVRRGRLVWSW
jgi:hypothetical protein